MSTEKQKSDYIGYLHKQYMTAVSEKSQLQAEVRRLKTLLREKGISHAKPS